MRTRRGKYLLYLCLYFIAGLISFLLLDAYQVFSQFELTVCAGLLIAIPFAAGAYMGISQLFEKLKQWQYDGGRDVYSEADYEDDAGFIHINQRAARVNKK